MRLQKFIFIRNESVQLREKYIKSFVYGILMSFFNFLEIFMRRINRPGVINMQSKTIENGYLLIYSHIPQSSKFYMVFSYKPTYIINTKLRQSI